VPPRRTPCFDAGWVRACVLPLIYHKLTDFFKNILFYLKTLWRSSSSSNSSETGPHYKCPCFLAVYVAALLRHYGLRDTDRLELRHGVSWTHGFVLHHAAAAASETPSGSVSSWLMWMAVIATVAAAALLLVGVWRRRLHQTPTSI